MSDSYDEQLKKILNDGSLAQSQQSDKAILMLSSSGFGISLAFIRFIAPNPSLCSLWILGGGWLAFLLSIATVLISFQFAIKAYKLEELALEFRRSNPDGPNYPENKWSPWIGRLNWFALGAFLLGALLVAVFAIVNIYVSKGESMETGKSQSVVTLEEGHGPPARPIKSNKGNGKRGALPPARPDPTPPRKHGGHEPPARPISPPPAPPKSK